MLYILIVLFSAIGSYFMPWWIIAPISFLLCAWMANSGVKAFWMAAAAIATLWIGYALYLDNTSVGAMTKKIGELFSANIPFLSKLPKAAFLMALMTIIGGTVAGFAGTAGYYFRQLLK